VHAFVATANNPTEVVQVEQSVGEDVLTPLFQNYTPGCGVFRRKHFLRMLRDCGVLVPDIVTIDEVMQVMLKLFFVFSQALTAYQLIDAG